MTLKKKKTNQPTMRLSPSACCSALSSECSGKMSGDPECGLGCWPPTSPHPSLLNFTYIGCKSDLVWDFILKSQRNL